MPAAIKNNIGILLTIASYLVTGAVSWGAAQTILKNVEKVQVKLEYKLDTLSDKVDKQYLDHDRRITVVETKIGK